MTFIKTLARIGQASCPIAGGTFTARRGPTLAMLCMLAVLLALGCWQVERLHWKEQLIQTITTRSKELPQNVRSLSPLYWHANGRPDTASRIAVNDLAYRPAAAIGQFLFGAEMFLTATSLTGEGGYHVLTPMQLEDGRWLLVDRGWIPYSRRPDPARDHGAAGFARPTGIVQVAGLLRLPQQNWLQPTNKPARDEWFHIDLPAMAQAAGIAGFLPFVLDADSDPNSGGFPVGGQTRLDPPNNHLTYSLIWFGLAAALLVIYGIHGWQPPAQPERMAAAMAEKMTPAAAPAPGMARPARRKPSWIAKLFEAPVPPPKPPVMLRLAPPAPPVVTKPPAPPVVTKPPVAVVPVEKVKRVRRKRKPVEAAAADKTPDMLTPAIVIGPTDSAESAAPAKRARKRRQTAAGEPVVATISATVADTPVPEPQWPMTATPADSVVAGPAAAPAAAAPATIVAERAEAAKPPAKPRARRTRKKAAGSAEQASIDTSVEPTPPPAIKPEGGAAS